MQSIRIMGQLQSENLGDRIFHALKHLKLSGYAKVLWTDWSGVAGWTLDV